MQDVQVVASPVQVKQAESQVKVVVTEFDLSIKYPPEVVVHNAQAEVVIWLLGFVNPLSFKVTLLSAVTSEAKAELIVTLVEDTEQVNEELKVDPTASQVTVERVNSGGIVIYISDPAGWRFIGK